MSNTQTGPNLPVGSVLVYAGSETNLQALQGWLPCDGRLLSSSDYKELFAAIGIANGGDGAGGFYLPNYQGYFIRGVSGASGHDPNALLRHKAQVNGNHGDHPGSVQLYATAVPQPPSTPFVCVVNNLPHNSEIVNDGSLSHNVMAKWNSHLNEYSYVGGASETRPKNKYVYFIIKSASTTGPGPGTAVSIPAGAVVPFAGVQTPGPGSQWLLCNGTTLNATQSQPLFAAIGTIHGGNGNPTFYLPDYQGFFLRGVSNATGNDPDADARGPAQPTLPPAIHGNSGNHVGSTQDYNTGPPHNRFSSNVPHLPSSHMKVDVVSGRTNAKWAETPTIASAPTSGGGQESRPVNAYVDWYIKAS
jgi:microcystin-dependent protein